MNKGLPLLLAVECDNGLVEVMFLNVSGLQYMEILQAWEYYMAEFDDGVLDTDALFEFLNRKGYEFEYRIDGGEITRYQ